MIECVEKNIYKKYKKKNKSKIKLFVFILFFVLFFLYYRFIIAENIFEVLSYKTNSIVASKVNEVILLSSTENKNFTKIEKNSQGEITLIGLDSLLINQFSRNIVSNVEKSINKQIEKGVAIPMLAFTGIKALSGYGKDISYNALEISTVNCEIDGQFKSVGINQTMHSIYANISVNIVIDAPFNKQIETFSSKVLISENIIIGKIPEIYLS